MKKAVLKKGREWPIQRGHLWVFSGALEKIDTFEDGEFLTIETKDGKFLGKAYFHSKTDIAGRIITHEEIDSLLAIEKSIKKAVSLRKSLFDSKVTNAYRVINAEADFLPGLIVDRYDNVLILQISTLGMEKIKEKLLSMILQEMPDIEAIYETSLSASRKKEGLPPKKAKLYGKEIKEVTFLENSAVFSLIPLEGQKTGFFLDQREMRQAIKKHAYNKKVLNLFSYTGGFSVFAALGGAKQVDSLDVSKAALQKAKEHMEKNGFQDLKQSYLEEDAFTFLEKEGRFDYDLVILDPPAFAKKIHDIPKALKGYRALNRLALRRMKQGAFLLTCSCSSLITEEMFEKTVFEAGEKEGKTLQVLSKHILAEDHPILASHKETAYLKSFLLRIL